MHTDAILPLLFLIGTGYGVLKLFKIDENSNPMKGALLFIIWILILIFLCYFSGCMDNSSNCVGTQVETNL